MQGKLIQQLLAEIEKHRERIEALEYGQVIFIVHGSKLVRGQIIENFETTKPDCGRSKLKRL
ncbi:MAG: hypothetical protein ACOY35_08245 [Bacillota bacterium]